MPKIYGISFVKARRERLEFAGGCCEVCGHDGTDYRLECHHRGSLAYARDEKNEMTMGDVLIVCVRHHDAITNVDRGDRYKMNASFEMLMHRDDKPLVLKGRINDSESQVDWNLTVSNAREYVGKPVTSDEKEDSGTDWETQENG